MRQKLAGLVVLVLLVVGVGERPLYAANAVVGTGTPASCTEAAFNTALATVQASLDGEISFNCGGPATIIFTSQKVIDTQLIIISGGGEITLSGGNSTRLFNVLSGSLELRNITLTNGNSGSGHGGAILAQNNTSVYLLSSTIQNSRTDTSFGGGAILSFDNSTAFPSVEIENSVIQSNVSGYGAINTVGRLLVRDSVIKNNEATVSGGGLSVGGPVTIQNSQIYSNVAKNNGSGGAMLIGATAYVLIENTVISENVAWEDGGGIYTAGELLIRNSTIYENDANDDGGGLFLAEPSAYVTIENSLISQNVALDDGGGIAILGGGEAILYQSTVHDNYAKDNGGGVYVSDSNSIARLTKSTLYNNSAGRNGGSVSILSGTTTFNNVTISKNSAINGGGISSFNGTATLTQVTMSANSAGSAGNLNLAGSAKVTTRNTIFNNPLQGVNCELMDTSVIISNGFNLSSDNSCSPFLNAGGDINNHSAQLGDLADNGGPTLTHMPLVSSPATDGGTCLDNSQMVDQRNEPRPAGNACDIGAVERQPEDGIFTLYLPMVVK